MKAEKIEFNSPGHEDISQVAKDIEGNKSNDVPRFSASEHGSMREVEIASEPPCLFSASNHAVDQSRQARLGRSFHEALVAQLLWPRTL